MPIIRGRNHVKEVYERAAQNGWVIPCFCTENLTTTEAILAGASEFGKEKGIEHIPVTLAITVRYEHRPQACNYTHSRNWETGLGLFRGDAEELMRDGGDYDNVDLLLHLDHVQYDLDEELCKRDLSGYSTIMYDASALPIEENIKATRKFVEEKGKEIVIEGACDEIVDAGGESHNEITTADKCKDYVTRTGVDMVVANLGTEHRASGKDLRYHGDAARAIRSEIGSIIVLHGTSSVSNDQVKQLFDDGVCKVNIWTVLERDSSPDMFEFLVKNASKAAGEKKIQKLIREGYLTEQCDTGEKESLSGFATVSRQDIVFAEMKRIVKEYLELWYV